MMSLAAHNFLGKPETTSNIVHRGLTSDCVFKHSSDTHQKINIFLYPHFSKYSESILLCEYTFIEQSRSMLAGGDDLDSPESPATPSDVKLSIKSEESTADMPVPRKQFPVADATKERPPRLPQKRKIIVKGDKVVIPELTAPLSELTMCYHIPIRNMEEWAHRPVNIRWKEVEKRDGYVARPMNSFMLYRSAYAERTKFWCLQNNHQVVSSVSGASWPLEPPHIRDYYNELARIERMNHQAAHPGYKFSPSKAPSSKKRKSLKTTAEVASVGGPDDVINDLLSPMSHGLFEKDVDGHSATKLEKSPWLYLGVPHNSTVGGPEISTFKHSNPGLDTPGNVLTAGTSGQYSLTTIHPRQTNQLPYPLASATVEDVIIRLTEEPNSKSQRTTSPMRIMQGNLETNVLMDKFDENPFWDALEEMVGCHSRYVHDTYQPANVGINAGAHSPNKSIYEFPLYCAAEVGKIGYATQPDQSGFQGEGCSTSLCCRKVLDMNSDDSLLGSDIDMRKLPGYDLWIEEYFGGEPWNILESMGEFAGEPLRYDDWLE